MNGKVAVIGGGPAGILAAGTAAGRGKEVILFEKNNKLGKKLFITGGGRCNITNKCDIETLIDNVVSNREFMYSAFYTFTNQDIVDLLGRYGVDTKIERGNRVFPKSDKSSDVIRALTSFLKNNNVSIMTDKQIEAISKDSTGKFTLKFSNSGISKFDKVVIATGGMSYPQTGSTGDGYKFAKEFGHSLVPVKPSLVPIELKDDWIKQLLGLSLKNVKLSAYCKNRKIHEEFGEMIFTHYGISGPIVLSMSNYINRYINDKISLHLDVKPALSEEKLEQRLIRDFEKYSRKQFKNALDDLLPRKMIPLFIQLADIDEDKFVNQITKDERKRLLNCFKELKMNFKCFRPVSEAIVTSGGISTLEINPSTMESKLVEDLFFAGEIIDVDALTGGFNLQIAFSTGYLAGLNC